METQKGNPAEILARRKALARERQKRWRKKHGYSYDQKRKANRLALKALAERITMLEEQMKQLI